MNDWESINFISTFDERRNIAIPGDLPQTIDFCACHFLENARKAIREQGFFAVALSGGRTPQMVYERIVLLANSYDIDWNKVFLFWSDERAVPPDHKESNFRMAMSTGFASLPIPRENIFRMKAEKDIEAEALAYEALIYKLIPSGVFDMVLLGVGEDGHTASLFPETHGLHVNNKRLVIANFIPSQNAWRMTLTFDSINAARRACVYAFGKSKAAVVSQVLNSPYQPDHLPAQRIGTSSHKALWILDQNAAEKLVVDKRLL